MRLVEYHMKDFISLCSKYKVDKIYLFGSATTQNFTDKSDVDFLVRFRISEIKDYFNNYLRFKESLENLLGRHVDLVEEQSLKNPILIKSIDQSKELIYG